MGRRKHETGAAGETWLIGGSLTSMKAPPLSIVSAVK